MLNLKLFIIAITTIFALIASPALATEYKFANKEQAVRILTANDEFLTSMNANEIALRVGSPTVDKTLDDLKAHYAANVIEWPESEMALMKALLVTHKKKLAKISHLLPEKVYFIKVTHEVESGISHTRGNAFVSPQRRTSISTKQFFHQIFHILSRYNRIKRASLYNIIGFRPCYFQPTEEVDKYSVKTPEAPFTEFFLPVEIDDEDSFVMSYLHTDKDGFDPTIERGFDGHISGDLIEVTVDNGICKPALNSDGSPRIYKQDEIADFYDTVGRNTRFDIHPEEIIADNFAFLMMNTKELANPEIPEEIEEWLGVEIN